MVPLGCPKDYFYQVVHCCCTCFGHGQQLHLVPSGHSRGQRCYLAALFFHGLSNKFHRESKMKVHYDALTGSDTVPCTYDKVFQLADQNKLSYQQRPSGRGGGRLAFAQKGKLGLTTSQAPIPLNTSAKKDKSRERKPHPIPGKKDSGGKMLANSLGKKNCFNCGGNDHWVINCPGLLAAQPAQ